MTFNQATATGLSFMLDGAISHDGITRFLPGNEFASKDLWLHVKSTVRQVERDDGDIVFDDTIQEKQWTDESGIMCWYYDHSPGRSVHGINFLNCHCHSRDVSIPVTCKIIHKPIFKCDLKTKKVRRRPVVTKNELMRQMLATAINCRFSSMENMNFIKRKNKKDFIPSCGDINPYDGPKSSAC
ncbi:MAG: hypothetical protein GY761_01975 [Hyphomicrobiales bacterium]|nr:hypothetical protein [Hyphomicrobiales bacterium]